MRRHIRPPRRESATTDARPAEARLAAMLAETNPVRASRIFARIREAVSVEPPVRWLTAARALHERGAIGRDAYRYFVTIFVEGILEQLSETDPELVRLGDAMHAIERAHGLEELESFFIDEAPDDWRQLERAWGARADALEREYLREHGFGDVADEMERDLAAFDRHAEAGRLAVWPGSVPLPERP